MRKRAPGAAATLALFAACILAATSCGQDPTFWDTSRETPPVPPRIPGGPSKMVSLDWGGTPSMFVASGNLFRYTAGNWAGVPQPPGRAFDVATAGNYLFVLSGDGINNNVWRIQSGGTTWDHVGSGRIQTIFANGTELFAGMRTGNDGTRSTYGIWRGTTNLTQLIPAVGNENDLGLLSGAAGDYLSTRRGLFEQNGTPVPGTEGQVFMGMIVADGQTLAIRRDGAIFSGNDNFYASIASTGDLATGALAVWEGFYGGPMLVVGIQGGNRRFGYVEFGFSVNNNNRRAAGSLLSVPGAGGNAQYTASLGRIPVNHLYQFNGTIFASTQSEGLWHYGSDRWRAIPR